MNRLISDSVLLTRILDLADDAILTTDLAQRIQYFNAGAERTFGYSREEVIGQPVDILIPAGFRHNHAQYVKEFSAKAESSRRMGERKEIFGLHKNGTQFPAEASISKAELDGTVLYMVILRDIKLDPDDKTQWIGGDILDPNNGKVYKVRIKTADGGKKLEVRGYIGAPLLGRTQTWIRVE